MSVPGFVNLQMVFLLAAAVLPCVYSTGYAEDEDKSATQQVIDDTKAKAKEKANEFIDEKKKEAEEKGKGWVDWATGGAASAYDGAKDLYNGAKDKASGAVDWVKESKLGSWMGYEEREKRARERIMKVLKADGVINDRGEIINEEKAKDYYNHIVGHGLDNGWNLQQETDNWKRELNQPQDAYKDRETTDKHASQFWKNFVSGKDLTVPGSERDPRVKDQFERNSNLFAIDQQLKVDSPQYNHVSETLKQSRAQVIYEEGQKGLVAGAEDYVKVIDLVTGAGATREMLNKEMEKFKGDDKYQNMLKTLAEIGAIDPDTVEGIEKIKEMKEKLEGHIKDVKTAAQVAGENYDPAIAKLNQVLTKIKGVEIKEQEKKGVAADKTADTGKGEKPSTASKGFKPGQDKDFITIDKGTGDKSGKDTGSVTTKMGSGMPGNGNDESGDVRNDGGGKVDAANYEDGDMVVTADGTEYKNQKGNWVPTGNNYGPMEKGSSLKDNEVASADSDGDIGGGKKGDDLLGGLVGAKDKASSEKTSDGMTGMKSRVSLDLSSNAGNQKLQDAANAHDKGGRDAQDITDKSTSDNMKTEQKSDWGKLLADAVGNGVASAGAEFGKTVAEGSGQKAGNDVFGTGSKSSKSKNKPVSSSSGNNDIASAGSSGDRSSQNTGSGADYKSTKTSTKKPPKKPVVMDSKTCSNCGYTMTKPRGSAFPRNCPRCKCGPDSVLVECSKCGYTYKGPASGAPRVCPRCPPVTIPSK